MNERDHRHNVDQFDDACRSNVIGAISLAVPPICAAARHGSAEFLVLWSSRHTVRTISFAEFEQYVAVAMHHIQRALSSIETPPRGCRCGFIGSREHRRARNELSRAINFCSACAAELAPAGFSACYNALRLAMHGTHCRVGLLRARHEGCVLRVASRWSC